MNIHLQTKQNRTARFFCLNCVSLYGQGEYLTENFYVIIHRMRYKEGHLGVSEKGFVCTDRMWWMFLLIFNV